MFQRRRLGSESAWQRRRRRLSAGGPDSGPSFYVQPVGDRPADGGLDVPDLLHDQPRAWGDLSGSAELVRFAFEGGDCAGVFDVLVDALPLAPTRFVAPSFSTQLYLRELIRACMSVTVDGRRFDTSEGVLLRILGSPPEEPADVAVRQRVLEEVASQASLRADLERLYLGVRRLRASLECPPSAEPNTVRRKIAVLAALKDCVDTMADGFTGAESALSRLRERGRAVRDTEAYARLVELLDYEGDFATVDIRLGLGADGTIRGFGVLAIRENTDNPLLPGPVRRFFQRVFAFLRGHRYGESEVVVRLLEVVFGPLVDEVVALLALTGALELYLASLGFRDLAASKGLTVTIPELVDPPPLNGGTASAERHLEGLFNPLLFLQDVIPRPCDLGTRPHDALVVVTGPNSGGKTRLLQALALAQLMGQVGLFVPAARARLVRAPTLFVSLVTDADAAQVEGRLGTELLRIRHLFEELEPGSFAILDELCSGTNPMEGEAIFEMVVGLLPRLRPQVFVSTHFLGLAKRLEHEPPVAELEFLQVELDADEHPTYSFVPGVATTSLAHKVAARLGVTQGELEALVEEKARAAR